jgi:HSP20 family protein
MFHKTYNTRNFGVIFPALENILNEVANAPLEDLAKEATVKFTRPKANITELDDSFEISLALPGFSKQDINIKIDKNKLIVSSDKEFNVEENFKLKEFSFGKFSRTFILPKNVDKNSTSASFNNGILTLSIAKLKEAEPKNIKIK